MKRTFLIAVAISTVALPMGCGKSGDDTGDTGTGTVTTDTGTGTVTTDTGTATTDTGTATTDTGTGTVTTDTGTVTTDTGTATTDTGSGPTDLDGDGVPADEDCDDNDRSLGAQADDRDCDGSLTADDCDDSDPGVQECLSYSRDVERIFSANSCLSCHGGSGGLTISYRNIVGVASSDVRTMELISPFSSSDSYIWHKINGTHRDVGGAGSKMGSVSGSDLNTIESWINQGANP